MKFHTASLSIVLFAVVSFAQTPQERQILVTPNAEHPQIAKDSGLGGTVRVAVTVDQAGNVIAVGEPTGPGNVCPSVVRADVVALRESARAASVNAKFSASADTTPSVVYLTFSFPSASSNRFTVTGDRDASAVTAPREVDSPQKTPASGVRFTVKGDRDYSAANASPPDYKGPVNTGGNSGTPAGGSSSVPKQISGGVLNGKAMVLPKPPYPPAARAVRASGAVSIQVLIDEDGQIFSASAVSGHPLLRAAARNAACEAVFTPTLLMGNPVKVSGVITYNFVP